MPTRNFDYKIRTSYEGADEAAKAERDLEDLGNAARTADSRMDRLADAADALARELDDVADEARQADRALDNFGDSQGGAAKSNTVLTGNSRGTGSTGLVGGFGKLGAGLLALTGGGAILDAGLQLSNAANDANLFAAAIGASPGKVLSLALELESSGLTLEDFRGAILALQRAISTEDKGLIQLLEKSGITLAEFSTLDPVEQLTLLDQAFGDAAEGPAEIEAALRLLGEKGPQLLDAISEDTQTRLTDKQAEQAGQVAAVWGEVVQFVKETAVTVIAEGVTQIENLVEAAEAADTAIDEIIAGRAPELVAEAAAGTASGAAVVAGAPLLAGAPSSPFRSGQTVDPSRLTREAFRMRQIEQAEALGEPPPLSQPPEAGGPGRDEYLRGVGPPTISRAERDDFDRRRRAGNVGAGANLNTFSSSRADTAEAAYLRTLTPEERREREFRQRAADQGLSKVETDQLLEHLSKIADNTDVGGRPNTYVVPTGTLPTSVPGVETGAAR